LVETPIQIGDQIDTYIAASAYFSRGNRVSIASDDYVDGGTLAADYMGAATDDSLVDAFYDSNDVPPLLNTDNDLVYFAGHGDYNVISTGSESFVAGNHGSYGDTAAVNDLPNAVIVTSGCHNGASFGNNLYHAPDAGTTYSEFPEEFGDRLVGVYVGATGYTAITGTGDSADVSEVGLNEKLSTYVIKHLAQDGNITAGEAFKRAVNSYIADDGAIDDADRRVISITTLYGIPNYRAPLAFILPPWHVEYWLERVWIDPPPYIDPDPFRFRLELSVKEWQIVHPGPGPEWYLNIPGAFYRGSAGEPLLPVIRSGVALPPGSIITGVEWNQAASESQQWTADGPMYVPPVSETVDLPGSQLWMPESFTAPGLYPELPYTPYSTTLIGDMGILAGLSIFPVQHDPKNLETTLWTTLVFTVSVAAGESTDGDEDGLPTYWELVYDLDDQSAAGDDGAAGDPDQDELTNLEEFNLGADPQDADTDDDGWSDGFEVNLGTDPLNSGSYPQVIYLSVVLK
jgi:hypothetical protein